MYRKGEFIPFTGDQSSIAANLDAAYGQLADVRRTLDELPVTMRWVQRSGVEYLSVKETSSDNGTTKGARGVETERILNEFTERKAELKARVASLARVVAERASQFRATRRLPLLQDEQAQLLRALDYAGLLGTDLMVVGTNAFAAYEMACRARFPVGNEATLDFDLAWCRGTSISLAARDPVPAPPPALNPAKRHTLFGVLRSINSSYAINRKKPYQAVNSDGYEVELLAAPSTHPLPRENAFEPMATLVEQEWLLNGSPLSTVVATQRNNACPLFVPDPRWMSVHKIWLSRKPERNPQKRDKDARQGNVLLDATRYFLADSHPLDLDFVFELPTELRDIFSHWAESRSYDPNNPLAANA